MKTLRVKLFMAVLCIAGSLLSIKSVSAQSKKEKRDSVIAANYADSKNLVKLNVPALFLKNFSFQYERAVGRKISVGLGVRFAPKSTLPFKSKFKDLADDDEVSRQIDNFKTGNFALTPEVRFYLGKKGVFRGFYLAPFARYATYSGELPYEYDYETATGQNTTSLFMSGRINTISGGLMIGAQWKLSRQVYLDWWILGASAGSSTGNLNGTSPTPLSNEEQEGLREALADLNNDFIKTESTVDANGAHVKIDGPWYTVRAGICVGVRF
jgi:hypothetical protein